MKKIGDFLGRFAKIAQEGADTRGAVIAVLKESGVTIRDEKKMTIKGHIVTLPLSPSQKSEVFLKQNKILALLGQNPLTKHITVVR